MQRAATPLVDRRYEITAILMEQAHERHYAARHVELAMPVRIVVCERTSGGKGAGTNARVSQSQASGSWLSVSLLTNVRHPVLPRVRDCFRHSTLYYVVTDEVGGETLSTRLARGDHFSPAQVLSIGLQLCDALAYLADFAPRLLPLATITPETVALLPSGGVALTCLPVGRWLGTCSDPAAPHDPLYTAPELLAGDCDDVRSDLYSVAALLYTLLSSQPDTRAGCPRLPLMDAAPHLPAGLVAAVERGVHPDASQRFASAFEFGTALAACAYTLLPASAPVPFPSPAAEPTPVRVSRPVPRPQRQKQRPGGAMPIYKDRPRLRALPTRRPDSPRQPYLLRTGERALAALSSALHRSA